MKGIPDPYHQMPDGPTAPREFHLGWIRIGRARGSVLVSTGRAIV
jgi:hypothetical protein